MSIDLRALRINARQSWQILLVVAMLMFCIGMVTDSTDVRRYCAKMEKEMAEGDYEEALAVGEEADATDSTLTMLRIEALGKTHQLGDRLFTYPVVCSGKALVGRGGDYELCAYLIDRQLDDFVEALPRYYSLDDRLPRHYREALTLYKHLRSNPKLVYRSNVMETDYQDMRELEKKYPLPSECQLQVKRHYAGTYWYYFDYEKE